MLKVPEFFLVIFIILHFMNYIKCRQFYKKHLGLDF